MAQREVRRREEQLRSLVNCLEDIVYVVDRDLRVTFVAGASLAAYVPESDSMSGAAMSALFGACADAHEEACRSALTGEHRTYEWTWHRAGGPVHFINTVSPIRDAAGQITRAVGIGRNITAQRSAEEALQESNEALRAIISTAPLGIITVGPSGRVRSCNPAASKILGWSELELLGRTCPLGQGTPSPRLGAVLASTLKGEVIRNMPLRTQSRTGKPLDVHLSAAALTGDGGQVNSVLLILADVTREVQSQHILSRYQLLARHTSEIMLFVGADGRILEANLAAEAAYGYDRDTLSATAIRDLCPGGECNFAKLLGEEATGSAPYSFESSHRRKDGRTFPAEVSVHLNQVGGEPVALMLVRDITNRKFLESLRSQLRPLGAAAVTQTPLSEALRQMCAGLAKVTGSRLVCAWVEGKEGLLDPFINAWWGPLGLEEPVQQWAEETARSAPGRDASTWELRTYGLDGKDEVLPSHLKGLLRAGTGHFTMIWLVSAGKTVAALGCAWNMSETAWPAHGLELGEFAAEVTAAIMAARAHEQIRLQTVVLQASDTGVVITDREGRIRWINRSFTQLTGYSLEEAVDHTPRLLKSGRNPSKLYTDLWQTILAGQTWRGELYNRRKDGSVYTEDLMVTPVTGACGEITHFIAMQRELTAHGRQEETRRFLANHDPITRLPNRRSLLQDVNQALAAVAQGDSFCLLVLDLDGFKQLNNRLGPLLGDHVISVLTEALLPCLRANDCLARIGPDEFAILLPGLTAEAARPLAEQVRHAVRDIVFTPGERAVRLTACIGMADVRDAAQPEIVLARAEAALLKAKSQGPNRIHLFASGQSVSPALYDLSVSIERFREDLEAGRFHLVFQPIVPLKGGPGALYETLLRYTADDGTTVAPTTIITMGERSGWITYLDSWVVDQAAEALRTHPGVSLFVNMSGHTLGDHDFLYHAETLLRREPSLQGRLHFEITETHQVGDPVRVRERMVRLKALGCRFALDDFGTGFSSFAYVQALPVDYVKIDGSFVRHMATDTETRSMVAALVTMLHALGKQVVAEHVETGGIAALLREMGVDYGQGYVWGRPSELPPMIEGAPWVQYTSDPA